MVAHLRAALRLFERHNINDLWARSLEYRDRLVDDLRDLMEFAAAPGGQFAADHSFIVTMWPKAAHRWRDQSEAELRVRFEEHSVSVSVLRLGDDGPIAVRTTLPYFINLRDTEAVVRAIRGAVLGAL